MKLINRSTNLLLLSAKIDSVLEFKDPNDKDSGAGLGLGTAAVGTGVAGLGTAYAAGASDLGARGIGSKLMQNAQSIGNGGISDFARTVGAGASKIGTGVANNNLVKNVIAKARGLKLSAKPTNMVELNEVLDDVIEFMSPEEFEKRFKITPDELNRVTKTGPYEDPLKKKVRQVAGGALLGGAAVAGAYSGHRLIKSTGGYKSVARDVMSRVRK